MSVIFFGFDGDFRVLRKKSESDIMATMNKTNFGLLKKERRKYEKRCVF